jgi:hypothetical protein
VTVCLTKLSRCTVAIAIALGSWSATAFAQATPQAPRFDHQGHTAKVKSELDCNNCHKLSPKNGWAQNLPVGKAGEVHSACSAAGCHQAQYQDFSKGRNSAFCFTCHTSKLGKALVFPPYRSRSESDFHLAKFSHKDHMREGMKGCELCHSPLKKQKSGSVKEMSTVGHDTCGNAICHGERVPPQLALCTGCHIDRPKELKVAERASSEMTGYRVDKLFSHTDHAKKSKKDQCGTCHVNVAVGAGTRPPLPPMIACESCHNGTDAFAALGTLCKKCHVAPEVHDAAK